MHSDLVVSGLLVSFTDLIPFFFPPYLFNHGVGFLARNGHNKHLDSGFPLFFFLPPHDRESSRRLSPSRPLEVSLIDFKALFYSTQSFPPPTG